MKPTMPPLEEYVKHLEDIWESHRLTSKGSKHEALEQALKDYLEVEHASLFVNGHLALESILEAFELKGEIITTAFTFPSTVHAIVRKGCTPVFADIKIDDFTLDPASIEACITDKTVAILPVHVLGNPCDVEAIDALGKKYNLKVIYDAAHVFGVKINGVGIGNFGDASMFSMNATKVFSTIEGGLVTFKDPALVKMFEDMKYYGIQKDGDITYPGSNLKMNEFQAAMGLVNLSLFEMEVVKRNAIVKRYQEALSTLDWIHVPRLYQHVRYNSIYYPLLIKGPETLRDELKHHLAMHGIETKTYFSPLATQMTCYQNFAHGTLSNAQTIANQVLVLPLFGELSIVDQTSIINSIKEFKFKRSSSNV
jgi:dTDP-4-amino-4,6-dideoxygalactose transaminase